MNHAMADRWKNLRIPSLLKNSALSDGLRKLADAPLMETAYGTVLLPLLRVEINLGLFSNRTGCEAYTNKVLISDFPDEAGKSRNLAESIVQAVLFARRMRERLNERPEKFRILVGLDPYAEEVTVRFFTLAPDESWGSESLDENMVEEVIVLDCGNGLEPGFRQTR